MLLDCFADDVQTNYEAYDGFVIAHGSDMTVYEVGHDMKSHCRFLESYDMTLESVIAKVMWMLGNFRMERDDMEALFYRKINHDVIFGINRKC